MDLKAQLTEDLKNALKSADQTTVGVLRLLMSAIKNKEIENRTSDGGDALDNEGILKAIAGEAKKRKDSIEAFRSGGREDLAAKEESELKVLQNYLPKPLSAQEVEKIVGGIIEKTGAADLPTAMKAVMQELRGKADGKLISEIVKNKIK